MSRFTRSERLALILLLLLVLTVAFGRWWKTRAAGHLNRETLPLVEPPSEHPESPQPADSQTPFGADPT